MKVKMVLILLLTVFLIFSCQKENSTEPENENVHPQQDIAWPSLADSPWPMHHHDPQSTGRSPFEGANNGNALWRFEAKAPVGTSVAIGNDSIIYFASSYDTSDGYQAPFLYALTWNGKLKWKLKLRGESSFADASQACSPLVAADGTIYIGSRDHLLYAVNPEGTIKWTFQAEDDIYPISLNVDMSGNIYFTAADNALYCVSPNGTLNWKSGQGNKFLCVSTAGISFSPDGTTLYLGMAETDENTGLAAVDLNGNVKWLYKTGLVDCTPLVDNEGNIFFGAGMGLGSSDEGKTGIFSLDANGDLRWKYLSAYVNNKDVTIDNSGNIYFSVDITGTKNMLVSLTNEGEKRWEMDISEIGALTSSLVCDRQGTIFGSAWPSTLYAVSSTGKMKWQMNIGEISANSPAIASGRIIAGTWYRSPGKEIVVIK